MKTIISVFLVVSFVSGIFFSSQVYAQDEDKIKSTSKTISRFKTDKEKKITDSEKKIKDNEKKVIDNEQKILKKKERKELSFKESVDDIIKRRQKEQEDLRRETEYNFSYGKID